jgi:alpha-amylase
MPCDTGARKYCGGSWSGIMNHLDYIQSMGFDAVWISPISANLEGTTSQGEAFHGCVRRPTGLYRRLRSS